MADRHLVHRAIGVKPPPHFAAHCPVQLAHTVGRPCRLEREDGHAKLLVFVIGIHSAKRKQLLGIDLELVVKMTGRIIHQPLAEPVVTGRHRGVRGKQTLPLGLRQRIVKPDSGLDPLPHQFQRKKRGVAFVHVKHRRLNTQPAQQPNASHAEQDFLHDAGRVIAAVDTLREVTKVRLIRRQVGVDEINRAAADVDHPDPKLHRLGRDLDFTNDRLALVVEYRLKREIRRVELAVILRLPVVGIDRLLKVAFAVKQTDTHKTESKVAGRLGVVAGQHSQPTGCDRQSLVKAELRAEIGHRTLRQVCRIRRRPSVGRV